MIICIFSNNVVSKTNVEKNSKLQQDILLYFVISSYIISNV